MQQLKASKVDNLSSFAVKLKEVENAHVKGADDRLTAKDFEGAGASARTT